MIYTCMTITTFLRLPVDVVDENIVNADFDPS